MNEYVDIYCERIEPGLWAEPINLVTNLSFIIAAIYVWPKVRHDIAGRLLSISLFSIGIGSGLFHSLATQWSAAADVISILINTLIYVYFATRRVLGASPVIAGIAVLCFVPYSLITEPLIASVTGPLNGSTEYLPILLLIGTYAVIAIRVHVPTARGLGIAFALLAVSITFRSFDMALCNSLPIGTHFLWHTLNGILLGWMTIVMSRMPGADPRPVR